MNHQNLEQQFYRYVIPSMVSMLLCAFYSIVDGFFIGHSIGDNGLAAINIAWPITAVILATGTGIGTGGAALMSIQKGKNQLKESTKTLGNTLLMLFCMATFLFIIFGLSLGSALQFLGAEGAIYTMAYEYGIVIVLGTFFQVFGTGLSPILRNDQQPKKAMLIMGCGLITNIILDAIFVMQLDMGLAGAAIATVIAQCVTAAPCFIYLLKKDGVEKVTAASLQPDLTIIKTIVKIGISPFGISMIFGIIIILNNWQTLNYGGAAGVAAYTIICYILSPVQYLVNGVGEGAQPLVSYSYGAGLTKTQDRLLKRTLILSLCVGGALGLCTFVLKDAIPGMFGASPDSAPLVAEGLVFLAIGLPCMAVVKVFSSYFYATQNMPYSTMLIFGDACILTPLFLVIFPQIWGLKGVWMVYPAVQILLMLSALFFWKLSLQKQKQHQPTTISASI